MSEKSFIKPSEDAPEHAEKKGESKRSLSWLFGLCGLFVVGAIFYFVRPYLSTATPPTQAEKPSSPVTSVFAQAAIKSDLPVYLNALGTITGLHTVTVKSRVDGELVKVAFQEGALVKAGDILAEIDPRPFQIQLMQSEGQLQRDEALLNNAQLDLQRYQTLLKQDAISSQQTATQAATVKQYQGIVETDKALVANAKLQLSYAKITAPMSGRLGLRLVDQGNIIKATDAGGIVVISQTQPIAVVFTVPEDQIPALLKPLHKGKTLVIEAYDRSGKNQLAQGQLRAVDNQIDVNTGTLKLKGEFANTSGALFANQFVNIRMQVDTLRDVIVVPSAAVQTGNNDPFVYVVDAAQIVSMRRVKLGTVYQEQTAVLDGLQADELVVVEGTDKLREGAKVRLIERDTANHNAATSTH